MAKRALIFHLEQRDRKIRELEEVNGKLETDNQMLRRDLEAAHTCLQQTTTVIQETSNDLKAIAVDYPPATVRLGLALGFGGMLLIVLALFTKLLN